jgi:hypothetical protein
MRILAVQRKKVVHRVVDGLLGHKKATDKEYAASAQGTLTLHFLRAGPASRYAL